MLDDRAFLSGNLMREAGLYVRIPALDELPAPKGRLDPSLAEVYRDHIQSLVTGKIKKVDPIEQDHERPAIFLKSISDLKATFSKCLLGDPGSLPLLPRRIDKFITYSFHYYGRTVPFHESLEYAIAAARAAQHIVLKRKFHRPPAPKPSRNTSDAEIIDLIRAEGDRSGGSVPLNRGFEIAKKADPAITRAKAWELTKSVYGNHKPGPTGPRKPRSR